MTQIKVKIETYDRLVQAKLSQGESFDYLLTRLLDKYEGFL